MTIHNSSFGTPEYDQKLALEAVKKHFEGTTFELEPLGKGLENFGSVFNIKMGDEETGKVIKITPTSIFNDPEKKDIEQYLTSIRTEGEILRNIKSKNIMKVDYCGVISDIDKENNPVEIFYMISEKLNPIEESSKDKSAFTYDSIILGRDNHFNIEQLCRFIKDITSAIRDFRKYTETGSKNETLVHRDIKLSNIMYSDSEEEGITYKLIDFGTARLIEKDHTTINPTQVSSEDNVAPELEYGLTEHVDIYALGSAVYRSLSHNHKSWKEISPTKETSSIKHPSLAAPLSSLYSQGLKAYFKDDNPNIRLSDYYSGRETKKMEDRESLLPDEKYFSSKYLKYGYESKYAKLVDLLRHMLDANYQKRIEIDEIDKRVDEILSGQGTTDSKKHIGDTAIVSIKQDKESNKTGVNPRVLKTPFIIILFVFFLLESLAALSFALWPIISPDNFANTFSGSTTSPQQMMGALQESLTSNIMALVTTIVVRFVGLSMILVQFFPPVYSKRLNKISKIVTVMASIISIYCFFKENSIYSNFPNVAWPLRIALLCTLSFGFLFELIPTDNMGIFRFIDSDETFRIYQGSQKKICAAFAISFFPVVLFFLGYWRIANQVYNSNLVWLWSIISMFVVYGISGDYETDVINYIVKRVFTKSLISITGDYQEIAKHNLPFHPLNLNRLESVTLKNCDNNTLKLFSWCSNLRSIKASNAPKKVDAKKEMMLCWDEEYADSSYIDRRNKIREKDKEPVICFSSTKIQEILLDGYSVGEEISGFEKCSDLKQISLTHCGIKKLDQSLCNLEHLENINVDYNFLSEMPPSQYWKSLEITNFSCINNRIVNLSGTPLTILRSFDCSNNRIRNVDFLKDNCITLESCNISQNPLTQSDIERALSECTKIKTLIMGGDGNYPISSLEFLKTFEDIESLTATHGSITDISPLFGKNLVYLDLSYNKLGTESLSQLDKVLTNMDNPTLILTYNGIDQIDDLPQKIYHLLDLSLNPIKSFTPLQGMQGEEIIISYDGQMSAKQFIGELECLKGFEKIHIKMVPENLTVRVKTQMEFLGLSGKYTMEYLRQVGDTFITETFS